MYSILVFVRHCYGHAYSMLLFWPFHYVILFPSHHLISPQNRDAIANRFSTPRPSPARKIAAGRVGKEYSVVQIRSVEPTGYLEGPAV